MPWRQPIEKKGAKERGEVSEEEDKGRAQRMMGQVFGGADHAVLDSERKRKKKHCLVTPHWAPVGDGP